VRALVLTQRLPYAPNRGDRLRAFHQIRILQASGWTVDVLALVHDDEEQSHVVDLRQRHIGVETARVPHLRNKLLALRSLPGNRPLTLTLLDSTGLGDAIERLRRRSPDVLLACSSSMAAVALRPALADIPLVLDFVDVDSEKWRSLADRARWPLSWVYRREYRTLRAFEAHAARAAHCSVMTTERERQALLAIAPDARAEVLPNGIDLDRFRRPDGEPAAAPARVVFTGVMNYEPNADAAIWLARGIWPIVRSSHPEACLDIVGASPTAAVKALHDPATGVTVTGSVPDVRPYLWRARVAVAPLRVARGVQNKVLEAAAAGLPCVVTPAVAAGLPDTLRQRCPVASDAHGIAAALAVRLDMPAAHQEWSGAVAGLGWESALARLPVLLQEAAG
jgi:polysaccharide biosynthesis protein PslH